MLLFEKYTPYTLNGIMGNVDQIKRLVDMSSELQSGKIPRPIMLYGPPGIGKTTAAHAFAYSNGLELIEFNASDYLDSETLEKRLLPVTKTRNLFNKKLLILFDEIDELDARSDAGAERSIMKALKDSRHMMMFIANDYWDRKISFLRNAVDRIEFRRPRRDEVTKLLKSIAEKEGKKIDDKTLETIVIRANGDIRGAINDLELMFDSPSELIDNMGIRNRKVEIFSVLDRIFNSSSFDTARTASMDTDVGIDMLFNWIDQNIPAKYTSRDGINDAYESLSRASKFSETASRKNYYGYLRYASILMSSGVALANNGTVSSLNPYAFPAKIRHLSNTKKNREMISVIAAKLSPYFHTNKKDIVHTYLPMLNAMINSSVKSLGEERVNEFFAYNYRLEPEDVESITSYYKFKS